MELYLSLKIFFSIVGKRQIQGIPPLSNQKLLAMKDEQKDPNVKDRKYNGHPHLKLKRVKTTPRQKIRQLLRGFIPLDELRPGKPADQLFG
jgi:hypothetical protein